MRRISSLLVILTGGLLLAFGAVAQSVNPAMATGPTPTPTGTPPTIFPDGAADDPCQLLTSIDCVFVDPVTERPVELAGSGAMPRLYPESGARNVVTHTLVSIRFDKDLDATTLNERTFSVTLENRPVEGAITYIDGNRIAIFYPDAPLQPAATYTARVRRGVRDISGLPLPQDIVWSFTTTAANFSPANELTVAGTPLPGSGMNIYFGDLHSHSFYSDGWGTPEQAYETARAIGLDFFSLTDHAFMLTEAEWQATLAAANAATQANFVGLRGFEYTNLYGHINVFDTDTFVHRNDPNYDTLAEFYGWLIDQPTAIAQFNHPLISQWHDWNFNDFAYNPAVDHKIVLRELSNGTQYFLSLNKGWHLGAVGNSDTHNGSWGERRLGVLAPELTRSEILDGLRARRTFFASPNHVRFAVMMQANGYWMGSAIPDSGSINFTIRAYDPSPSGRSLRLNLYDNGTLAASTSLPGNVWYTWTPTIPAGYGHYYYVEAYYGNWRYPAYTSPIWVKQAPLAKAGTSQIVGPGNVVTLDGSGSWDPDGDSLVYRWTQFPSPTVSLSHHLHQPAASFVAPNIIGDMVFNLTVTDPGGLSNTDSTVVTITDKPVLKISKQGPASAKPNELITYLLTVQNVGINPANQLVITDIIPSGAVYESGGALLPGNIVSWTVPELAAGATHSVSFSVRAAGAILNKDYGASCAGCIPAKGQVHVLTNGRKIHLPMVRR